MYSIHVLYGTFDGRGFSKFSRPSARVVFSDKIISTTINKVPSLVLRVANVRVNSIYEGRAELSLLRSEITSEGEQIRRIISLKLIRETTPLFSLSWTLMHTIDETSPFYKMSIDEIHQSNWEVIATFSGLDQDLGQSIVAHSVFTSRMIISAKKFEDMIQVENGIRTIDFTHLNKVIIPDLDA